jgi:hypothetical protein
MFKNHQESSDKSLGQSSNAPAWADWKYYSWRSECLGWDLLGDSDHLASAASNKWWGYHKSRWITVRERNPSWSSWASERAWRTLLAWNHGCSAWVRLLKIGRISLYLSIWEKLLRSTSFWWEISRCQSEVVVLYCGSWRFSLWLMRKWCCRQTNGISRI